MLTQNHLIVIRAALRYWEEEICPHGIAAMRPYLDGNVETSLSTTEVTQLRLRFDPARARYALCDVARGRLTRTQLFRTAEESLQCAAAFESLATVILPPPA